MRSKIIIERSNNIPPEDAVNERICKLGEGWKVTSAQTIVIVLTTWESDGQIAGGENVVKGMPSQVFYTTTVVLEKD